MQMRFYFKNILKIIPFLIFWMVLESNGVAFAQTGSGSKGVDTLFKKLSTEDLIKIRKYYNSKVQKLRNQEEMYRTEGMDWSQTFLKEKGSKVKDRDKLYIRLAEFYIEDADRYYDSQVDQYDSLYAIYEKKQDQFDRKEIEVEPTPPEFPKHDYSKAISFYDQILNEYPGSQYADDALYSKAWLLEKMDRGEESRKIYREVIDKYPDSRFAPESYMRLAEYYFSPREDKTSEEQQVVELRKAIQLYKNVLKYRNSKRYDEALYKLGWSYYKLASRDPKYYNDAITYFVMVADDIDRAQKLDPQAKISNFDVKDEAIQYIGISFTDDAYTKHGVDRARRLIERIGDRPYGPEIIQAMGRTYQKIDEPAKAIYAYQTLLDMYPYYPSAPEIQQNIVQSLFALGKDADAYQARKNLYEKYNSKSDWYARLDSSDTPDKVKYLTAAYKYSEEALRTNILIDLQKAEELQASKKPARSEYESVADLCKTYLTLFPADSNAYDVNWSYAYLLDSRLGRFEDAFNEYIRVSNDYSEDSHREDAALNAVGVADTLVKLKFGKEDTLKKFNLADVAKLSPEALTPEETRLIEAYDNYIRLFPSGKYTPNFLAAAGGIYYNHKKFAEAKIYFQTLVKRFPGAEQESLALRSIMDSYFALGRFKDSEMMAKRILNEPNVSQEQKTFAMQRMGQAIFKNAEYLEEQGDYFTAASEFYRVFTDAPEEPKIVETALFRSGLDYQKAKDWLRAISVYDTLAIHYPKSKFSLPALQNMAEDYKELDRYVDAAKVYERIFTDFRKDKNADAALYNAGFYYKKGKDWENAIRINKEYIQQYPDQSYAVDLFFANADLYLKLKNEVEANKIYQEFAQKYPDDPRTVTAFYERGNYYLENGQPELAKAEYNKAIQRSENFKKQGKNPNGYIAGEAVNKLAEILHKDYAAIQLKQPQSNIKANLARLRNLMGQLNDAYSKVLSFGSPRSFEATYDIARSYEEFAAKYANMEVDPNLPADKQFVEKKKINDAAAALYEKAVEEYKQVVDKIPVIAEKLGVDMNATTPDTLLTISAEEDTSAEMSNQIKRAKEMDSTRTMARKWYAKAKDKISELLYTEASLTTQNVERAVAIQAPQKDPVQRLIFKRAVLAKVAAPAIAQTIKAHIRNIEEGKKLGLSNKYIEESKRQILLTSNLMSTEFEKLSYSALDQFRKKIDEVKKLVEKDFGAKNAQGLDYYALDNDASQLIDYIKILAEQTITDYTNTLKLADEHGIKNDLVSNTQDRLLRFALEIGNQMQALADSSKNMSAYYKTRFDSTQNYNYDDATGFFENYFYSLGDNSKEIMDQAFQVQQEYNIHSLWANKLLLKLIELDPATYSANVEKEKVEIFSDPSWKYSTTYFKEVWPKPEFDDSNWKKVRIVPSFQNQFAKWNVDPQAIWVNNSQQPAADSLQSDSTLSTDSLQTSGMAGTDSTAISTDSLAMGSPLSSTDTLVFFRKNFELKGTPLGGAIYITADEDFRIYLNGEYLLDDSLNNYSVVDSLDYYTFDIFLKKGKNLIAVDVEDKDLTAKGLKFYAYFELLPADITAAAEEKAKVKKVFVDPTILRRVNILSRNRISLKQR